MRSFPHQHRRQHSSAQDTSGQGYSPDPSSHGQKGLGSRLGEGSTSRSRSPCRSVHAAAAYHFPCTRSLRWYNYIQDLVLAKTRPVQWVTLHSRPYRPNATRGDARDNVGAGLGCKHLATRNFAAMRCILLYNVHN